MSLMFPKKYLARFIAIFILSDAVLNRKKLVK